MPSRTRPTLGPECLPRTNAWLRDCALNLLAYYYTEVPTFFREVTRQTGTRFFLYYSGLVDGLAGLRHPGWRMLDQEDKLRQLSEEWFLGYPICPLSPYDEWPSVHFREMMATADPDGMKKPRKQLASRPQCVDVLAKAWPGTSSPQYSAMTNASAIRTPRHGCGGSWPSCGPRRCSRRTRLPSLFWRCGDRATSGSFTASTRFRRSVPSTSRCGAPGGRARYGWIRAAKKWPGHSPRAGRARRCCGWPFMPPSSCPGRNPEAPSKRKTETGGAR